MLRRAPLFSVLLLAGGAACNGPDAPRMHELGQRPGAPTGQTVVRAERLGSVPTGKQDALGRPQRVACVSCHSQRKDAALPSSAEELDEFHTGLRVTHGELTCGSCHDGQETHELRLASGEVLPGTEAMQLCAQCHGPQTRDYKRGSHGGMNGYWDLSRGDRRRNHCVNCHDPHAPAYQGGLPVLPPKDRFFPSSPAEDPHHD